MNPSGPPTSQVFSLPRVCHSRLVETISYSLGRRRWPVRWLQVLSGRSGVGASVVSLIVAVLCPLQRVREVEADVVAGRLDLADERRHVDLELRHAERAAELGLEGLPPEDALPV